jgi:hypothetical protein
MYRVAVGCHRSLGGTREAFYEQGIVIFSMKKKMKIVH